jgi:hypothetical protein
MEFRNGLGHAGFFDKVEIVGNGKGSQYPNNRDREHEFNEGEAFSL